MKIHLRIYSRMAVNVGRNEVEWEGDIDVPYSVDTNRVNDAIFRMFNRVEIEDEERLVGMDYRLPSLSVGDLIAWENYCFEVSGFGFATLGKRYEEAKEDEPRDQLARTISRAANERNA